MKKPYLLEGVRYYWIEGKKQFGLGCDSFAGYPSFLFGATQMRAFQWSASGSVPADWPLIDWARTRRASFDALEASGLTSLLYKIKVKCLPAPQWAGYHQALR